MGEQAESRRINISDRNLKLSFICFQVKLAVGDYYIL